MTGVVSANTWVMAGLVPAISNSLAQPCPHGRDRRHEAGDDAAGSPPEFTPDLIGGGDERS